MKVRDGMTPDPVTIGPGASLYEALRIMHDRSIRHLPVVDEGGRLLGLVTEGKLREAMLASMLQKLTMEEVMIRSPFTVGPDEPLEEAARLIYRHRVGGLPVVEEGERVVGIITAVDLLRVLVELLGLLEESRRLDVPLRECAQVEEVLRLVERAGGRIISVGMLPHEGGWTCHLRLHPGDLRPLVRELARSGYQARVSA